MPSVLRLRRRIKGRSGEVYPAGSWMVGWKLPGRKVEVRDRRGVTVRVLGPVEVQAVHLYCEAPGMTIIAGVVADGLVVIGGRRRIGP